MAAQPSAGDSSTYDSGNATPYKPATPRSVAFAGRRTSISGSGSPAGLAGVSNRTLAERHSICVVRGGFDSLGGPAALSRSGEVRLPMTPTARRNGTSCSRSACMSHTTPPQPAAAAASPAAQGKTAGARRVAGVMSASTTPRGPAAGLRTPPPSRVRTIPKTPAAAPASTAFGSGGSSSTVSIRPASTKSRLEHIFRKGSVQHPVAGVETGSDATHSRAADSPTPAGTGNKLLAQQQQPAPAFISKDAAGHGGLSDRLAAGDQDDRVHSVPLPFSGNAAWNV
eukprot:GHRR01024769.1.p1 GENE.GHRR01024769.1~~GHRR01024769.1.p1  ORF type:complete len:283 (+),score=133.64 GHRR01024769.1:1284-2132(+)